MVHQYRNNGLNIVLDVNSGSVHVVDDVVYDVLARMDENDENKYGELLDDLIRKLCEIEE